MARRYMRDPGYGLSAWSVMEIPFHPCPVEACGWLMVACVIFLHLLHEDMGLVSRMKVSMDASWFYNPHCRNDIRVATGCGGYVDAPGAGDRRVNVFSPSPGQYGAGGPEDSLHGCFA